MRGEVNRAFLLNQIVVHIVKMVGLATHEQLTIRKTYRDQTTSK
jgi:hypothetical protein